jgi:hypothetical protein
MQYHPDGVERSFYENASDKQLGFIPEAYIK